MRYLLLLLVTFGLHAQTYSFDQKITYLVTMNENEYEFVTFYNSKNPNYRLDYWIRLSNKEVSGASLSDFKTEEVHSYKFIRRDDGTSELVYNSTRKPGKSRFPERTCELVRDAKNPEKAELILYKNRKKKEIVYKTKLKVSESPVDLTNIVKFTIADSAYRECVLPGFQNLVIEEAEWEGHGLSMHYRKKAIEKIDVTMIVE